MAAVSGSNSHNRLRAILPSDDRFIPFGQIPLDFPCPDRAVGQLKHIGNGTIAALAPDLLAKVRRLAMPTRLEIGTMLTSNKRGHSGASRLACRHRFSQFRPAFTSFPGFVVERQVAVCRLFPAGAGRRSLYGSGTFRVRGCRRLSAGVVVFCRAAAYVAYRKPGGPNRRRRLFHDMFHRPLLYTTHTPRVDAGAGGLDGCRPAGGDC
jgi:hypothetical protein